MAKRKDRGKPTSNPESKIANTVECSVPGYTVPIDIYESTLDKLKKYGRQEYERLEDVYSTIARPTRAYDNNPEDEGIVLVNDKAVSTSSESPLCVHVKVFTDGRGIMRTAYFDRKMKGKSKKKGKTLIWSNENEE